MFFVSVNHSLTIISLYILMISPGASAEKTSRFMGFKTLIELGLTLIINPANGQILISVCIISRVFEFGKKN